jgi:hypothetical protein
MSRRLPLAAALAALAVVAIVAAAALLATRGGGDRPTATPGSGSSAARSSVSSSAPSSAPPSQRLVPATSRFPAAGVCGRTTGTVLTVRIEPDAPDPRCTRVDGSQSLRVVNRTGDYGQSGHAVIVTWVPGHRFTLPPGGSREIKQPFGAYLARGVHVLRVGASYRAEIWLP